MALVDSTTSAMPMGQSSGNGEYSAGCLRLQKPPNPGKAAIKCVAAAGGGGDGHGCGITSFCKHSTDTVGAEVGFELARRSLHRHDIDAQTPPKTQMFSKA